MCICIHVYVYVYDVYMHMNEFRYPYKILFGFGAKGIQHETRIREVEKGRMGGCAGPAISKLTEISIDLIV